MKLVARIVAVLLALVLYSFAYGVVVVGAWTLVTSDEPNALEFFDARDKAQADGVADECGYRAVAAGEQIRLTHDDIVGIARCFERHGYLTSGALNAVEGDSFEYTYGRDKAGHVFGGSTAITTVSAPRWIEIFYVLGLGVVVWLVGFRLPWWRRPRTS